MKALTSLCCIAGMTCFGQSQNSHVQIATPVLVLQGAVSSVGANWLQLTLSSRDSSNQVRRIDISSALYESSQGNLVKPFPIHIGDRLLVVVQHRFPALPQKSRSAMLPVVFRALVVELLGGTDHGVPPGADKG